MHNLPEPSFLKDSISTLGIGTFQNLATVLIFFESMEMVMVVVKMVMMMIVMVMVVVIIVIIIY